MLLNLIKQIGKQILRGKVNFTEITIPISVMSNSSTAQLNLTSIEYNYLIKSALLNDPIERLK